MKVVILAGGLGTRISEESHLKPKPMIEIGEKPMLWHIMKQYSAFGFNEFIICLGYKSYVIKEFFADYYMHMSDVTFDLQNNTMQVHNNVCEPWKVTLVETGLQTMTGGRIKRIKDYVGNEAFMVTYGDGVSDVNINNLIEFHKKSGKAATITAVRVTQRFGVLTISPESQIHSFREKQDTDSSWINGGFMVFEPKVFNYLSSDETVLEKEPFENLASDGQLSAFKHDGFWQCMDTQRDKQLLETLWQSGNAPWKIW